MFKSCYCPSGNQPLLLVARNDTDTIKISNACNNIGTGLLATELEAQDYQALGICRPPVMEQYYSIGLILPNAMHRNRSKSCRYNWSPGNAGDARRCVNGQPLILPTSFPDSNHCHSASIKPGSFDLIYNATWTRCRFLQYYICQVEADKSNIIPCENVSTPRIETKQTSSSMSTTATVATSETAIIVVSVLAVSVVQLFLLLLFIFYKKVKRKRNAPDDENQEEVYYK